MPINLHTSQIGQNIAELKAGCRVLLSGPVYTARDAAHKRLAALLQDGSPLPFALAGATIYYSGPTPPPPGRPVGSCGPTTSGRMDTFTPLLLANGLAAMIGKGGRSPEVVESIIAYGAVYFCAVGGAGALAASCVASVTEVAFSELGCESIKRLELRDFPVIVAIDSQGGNLFKR